MEATCDLPGGVQARDRLTEDVQDAGLIINSYAGVGAEQGYAGGKAEIGRMLQGKGYADAAREGLSSEVVVLFGDKPFVVGAHRFRQDIARYTQLVR